MITPTRKLFIVLLGLFAGEAAIMALINYMQFPSAVEAITDASALIVIALPILYLAYARPMIQQYQALEKANRTAETLLHTSAELAQLLDVGQVTDILLRQIKTLVPFDFAAVYTVQSPDKLILRTAWNHGCTPGDVSDKLVSINPQDHPRLFRIINEKKTLVIAEPQQAGTLFPPNEISQTHSWLGVPLVVGGAVIGVCEMCRTQPEPFTQDQVRLVEGIASQAAVAIQNAEGYEQVRESRELLRRLTGQFVEVQERERRLIARELHEDVAQTIAAALMQLRFVADKVEGAETLQASFEEIDQKLESIFKHLRRMAVDLRPNSLDTIGLRAAISQQLNKIQAENGLHTYLEVIDLSERLPEHMETILYRIVQEGLSNVVQHAQAARIDVTIQQRADALTLTVADDGCGFALEQMDQTACLGIIGMRERAEMIGGRLEIDSSAGRGTLIRVTLPTGS